MSTRTETTLTVKVNGREVNELDKAITRTFDSKKLRGLLKSVGETNKHLKDQQRLLKDIAGSIRRVGESAKEYDRLRKSVEETNRAVERLNSSMGTGGGGGGVPGRAPVAPRSHGGGYGGGGGRAGGVRGFYGGMRGVQLPTPGTGSLQAAFMGVPVLGGMAAGSFMAASGTYSSHLRMQQATQQAAPYLANQRSLFGYQHRQLSAATPDRYVGPDGSGMSAAEAKRRAAIGRNMAGAAAYVNMTPLGLIADQDALMAGVQRRTNEIAEGRGGMLGSFVSTVGGATAGLTDLIGGGPGVTQEAGARAAGVRRIAGRAATYSRPFTTGQYTSAGRGYGLGPQEAVQQASGLSRAAGFRATGEEFEFALALQQLTGQDLQTTGQLMKGTMLSGSNFGPEAIADMIGTAVAMGLEGSELNRHLSMQTQFLAQQTDMGRSVNTQGMMRAQMGMMRSGVLGRRTAQITQAFGAGAADQGFQGGGDALTLRLMRAMGYTGAGGSEEYAKYQMKMQDPGEVAKAMPAFTQQLRASNLGPEMQARIVQKAYARFGARIAPGEARSLAGGFELGEVNAAGLSAGKLMGAGRQVARGTASSRIVEAGIEGERVAVGAKMATTVQNLERTTIRMAQAASNFTPALEAATGSIEKFAAMLEQTTRGLGSPFATSPR